MKIRNEYLFNGILPGETEEKIISTLDKADKWESLSQSVRKDFWIELALPENMEEVKQLSKHVQKDYY